MFAYINLSNWIRLCLFIYIIFIENNGFYCSSVSMLHETPWPTPSIFRYNATSFNVKNMRMMRKMSLSWQERDPHLGWISYCLRTFAECLIIMMGPYLYTARQILCLPAVGTLDQFHLCFLRRITWNYYYKNIYM